MQTVKLVSEKAAMVTGINDSSMDERFAAQTFTLTSGRHITDSDTNVANGLKTF